MAVSNCFVRGSVVRYVQVPAEFTDLELLHDSSRIEARQQKKVQENRKKNRKKNTVK